MLPKRNDKTNENKKQTRKDVVYFRKKEITAQQHSNHCQLKDFFVIDDRKLLLPLSVK